jgi:hypothetical protein
VAIHQSLDVSGGNAQQDPDTGQPYEDGVIELIAVNLVVGAGVLLRNHAYFGASVDNNMFAVERTMFTPDLNGIQGDLQGTDYITRSVGRIEATIPEVSATVIAAGIPGATVTGPTAGMTIISDATTPPHPDSAYADWELDIDRLNGGQFQFEVDNAINTGNFEGELQDERAVRAPLRPRRSHRRGGPVHVAVADPHPRRRLLRR